jgi:hypothetical protein
MIRNQWLKVINNPFLGMTELLVLVPCISWMQRKRRERRTGTSKWNLLGRWDNAKMRETIVNEREKRNQESNLMQNTCNVHHQWCGATGGGGVTVLVCTGIWQLAPWWSTPSCTSSSSLPTTTWWCEDGDSGGLGKWKWWGQNDNREMVFHLLAFY